MMNDAICENCGNPFEECMCSCPYCGETSLCECCIGTGTATGG